MLIENIKEAFQNILGNRMRSLLTMLGIIIGISAVITITTIGASIQSTLNATMNALGGTGIYGYVDAIYPEDGDLDDWVYPDMTANDYITLEQLETLVSTYPDEIAGYVVSNSLSSGQVYKNSEKYANVSVEGITPYQLDYMHLTLLRGRNLTSQDLKNNKQVCLVSDTMASYYFGDEDPIGQQITYNGSDGFSYDFTVVGVYEYSTAVFGKQDTSVPEKDRTTSMYIPCSMAAELAGAAGGSDSTTAGYEYINLVLKAGADEEQALSDAQEYFSQLYANNEKWQVSLYSNSSDMGMIDTIINVVTMAISFIAAISLVVGGVGVMNIMLVSITERTKEIGIRKALGAKNRAIRQQFLIESVVLCLVGGIIGIVLGLLFGVLLGKVGMALVLVYYPTYKDYIIMSVHPNGIAILLSVGFSMLIGIFFGSYPAKKAAQMEVIDALRYE